MDTTDYVRRVLINTYKRGQMLSQALHGEPAYTAQSLELDQLLTPLNRLAEQLKRDKSYGLRDNAVWLNGEHLRDFIWEIEAWTETFGTARNKVGDELSGVWDCFRESLQHAVFVADVMEYRSAWISDALCSLSI